MCFLGKASTLYAIAVNNKEVVSHCLYYKFKFMTEFRGFIYFD